MKKIKKHLLKASLISQRNKPKESEGNASLEKAERKYLKSEKDTDKIKFDVNHRNDTHFLSQNIEKFTRFINDKAYFPSGRKISSKILPKSKKIRLLNRWITRFVLCF